MRSFVCSFAYLCVGTCSLVGSFVCPLVLLFVGSFVCPFLCWFVHSLFRLFLRSFVRSFVRSFEIFRLNHSHTFTTVNADPFFSVVIEETRPTITLTSASMGAPNRAASPHKVCQDATCGVR